MTHDWRTPENEAVLTGRVVYRCAACGGDIEVEEAVFADADGPLGDRPTTKTTRSYHPAHVPPQET